VCLDSCVLALVDFEDQFTSVPCLSLSDTRTHTAQKKISSDPFVACIGAGLDMLLLYAEACAP